MQSSSIISNYSDFAVSWDLGDVKVIDFFVENVMRVFEALLSVNFMDDSEIVKEVEVKIWKFCQSFYCFNSFQRVKFELGIIMEKLNYFDQFLK